MADNDSTQQIVVGDTRSVVAFDIAKFEADFRALPAPSSRRTPAVERDAADKLLKRMAEALNELAEGRQAAEDGKARIDEDRRRLRTENLALRQRLDERTGGPPAGAVAVMSGGQLLSEKVIDEAKAEANRILDDARLQAAALISADEPKVTGHRPTDFANMTAYVASQLPVAEKRVTGLQRLKADLLAEANVREAEREAWGEVLPLARQQLAGGIVDVRETQVAS